MSERQEASIVTSIPALYEALALMRRAHVRDASLVIFLPKRDFPALEGGQLLGYRVVLHDGNDIYVGYCAAKAVTERKWVRA